jgi:membrane fusion protein (multidrug efflux system)
MKALPGRIAIVAAFVLCMPACNTHREEHHHEAHKILATSPESKTVTITQQYVCQIRSQRHIKVRALERGYLETVPIREGQTVKQGDLLFNVIPVLYQAKLDAENAEAKIAQLEFNYTKKLYEDKVVSQNEVALLDAKLAKARAKADLAAAELSFATVKAPFDGIVDRLLHQHGSLVEEGEILTTLSDNSTMWVYFNMPESRYLEFMADQKQHRGAKIDLVLANGQTFDHAGQIGAIEADFNNETGNIPFRADFPNPERLLRHGQTGNVLLSRQVPDALVIPQRATFEVLDKRYVYVIEAGNVARQREIFVHEEIDDVFVIKKDKGVGVEDKIVLEGVRQIRDGDTVEFEQLSADHVAGHLKQHAE